ncbi:docking protein 1 [Fopius arisanus]|uniref:DOK2 protein n=1 Tax=Fopius arisanus TaxID=64838 RepID=A0A0C9QYI4_9HYME|nr:PREDICTED: docking protein 1 [Fopius arisanus]
MDIEDPVMQGLLLFPPQGVLGQLKKTWHKRYCQLFKASKYGIERLEIWDSKEDFLGQQLSPRIITLENCVKIGPSNQPKVIAVVTRSLTHHFGCITEGETRDWITAFQHVAFPDLPSMETIEEDNDLYCTSGKGLFSVKLVETDASKRCRLDEKNYTLLVGDTEMNLMDGDTVRFTWPYRYIRKYGYGEGKFTFEAGRKCESGEGSFRLEHSNQQEIFRCISSRMKSMKKLLRGEISTPGVDLNDVQYHAALSMEAGSRSPLPPTPTQNLIDLDYSSSQSSQRTIFPGSTSSSSIESVPFIRSPPPIVSAKPAKPPRKFFIPGLREHKTTPELPDIGCGIYRKLATYTSPETARKLSQTISSPQDDEKHPYDLVEVRNNAWRTHGIDTVVHTERKDRPEPQNPRPANEENGNEDKNLKKDDEDWVEVNVEESGDRLQDDEDSDCQYETMISNSTGLSTTETVTASPIIHNNLTKSDSTANYDTLQHFGSLHRLNNPGYKAPNLSLSLPMRNASSQCNSPTVSLESPSWNDYDVVEDVQAIRLADDSSRGYGVIRKKTNAATNVNTGPQQRIFNNSEYAIVSKPKRV